MHPDLKVLGAIMTMYDNRNKLSAAVFQELYQHFPHKVFRTVIPRNVTLAEAPSHGLAVKDYAAHSVGARAYRRLAQEIILENN